MTDPITLEIEDKFIHIDSNKKMLFERTLISFRSWSRVSNDGNLSAQENVIWKDTHLFQKLE